MDRERQRIQPVDMGLTSRASLVAYLIFLLLGASPVASQDPAMPRLTLVDVHFPDSCGGRNLTQTGDGASAKTPDGFNRPFSGSIRQTRRESES